MLWSLRVFDLFFISSLHLPKLESLQVGESCFQNTKYVKLSSSLYLSLTIGSFPVVVT